MLSADYRREQRFESVTRARPDGAVGHVLRPSAAVSWPEERQQPIKSSHAAQGRHCHQPRSTGKHGQESLLSGQWRWLLSTTTKILNCALGMISFLKYIAWFHDDVLGNIKEYYIQDMQSSNSAVASECQRINQYIVIPKFSSRPT